MRNHSPAGIYQMQLLGCLVQTDLLPPIAGTHTFLCPAVHRHLGDLSPRELNIHQIRPLSIWSKVDFAVTFGISNEVTLLPWAENDLNSFFNNFADRQQRFLYLAYLESQLNALGLFSPFDYLNLRPLRLWFALCSP